MLEINQMHDEEGVSYVTEGMIRTGMALNLNGLMERATDFTASSADSWEVSKLF